MNKRTHIRKLQTNLQKGSKTLNTGSPKKKTLASGNKLSALRCTSTPKKKGTMKPSRELRFNHLPSLSSVLQKAKDREKLHLHSRAFELQFASHLLRITDEKPSAQDYKTVGTAISDAYPEFRDLVL